MTKVGSCETAGLLLNGFAPLCVENGVFPMPRPYRPPAPKVRATLYLPQDLLDEARDATVHLAGHPLRLTLTKFVERAFRAELQRLKDAYNGGCDFPPREEELKGGRPIAA